METLAIVSLVSFLGIAVLSAHKWWHLHIGKIEEPCNVELVRPIVARAKFNTVWYAKEICVATKPVAHKLYDDLLLIAFHLTAGLAKRFAKLANEIKGKGELPEDKSTSVFLSYLNKGKSF